VKKLLFALGVSLCLFFCLTPAFSYAAAAHSNIEGGGCNNGGNGVVTIGSCISYDGNQQFVNSDAYITMPSNIAHDPSCMVYIYQLNSNHDIITWSNFPCQAGKQRYGPLSTAQLTGSYFTGADVQYFGNDVSENSPVVAL
jgi:hypothetical protein